MQTNFLLMQANATLRTLNNRANTQMQRVYFMPQQQLQTKLQQVSSSYVNRALMASFLVQKWIKLSCDFYDVKSSIPAKVEKLLLKLLRNSQAKLNSKQYEAGLISHVCMCVCQLCKQKA